MTGGSDLSGDMEGVRPAYLLGAARTAGGSERLLKLTGTALLLLLVIGIIGPLLPIVQPNDQDLAGRLKPPMWLAGGTSAHILGTDHLGRDMLWRLIAGARLSLLIAAGAVFVGATLGTVTGLIAGYRRGLIDGILSRIIDAQLAFPAILLAIAIISTQGRSLVTLIGVLAIVGWARYARVIRAETLAIRERPFILGLRAVGAPSLRIVVMHVLPNVMHTIIVLATLEVGVMLLAESALSFLGLGVISPDVSWGAMLAEGRLYLQTAWWVVTFPGIAITLVVLCVNLFGDALRARYDPRKRSRS